MTIRETTLEDLARGAPPPGAASFRLVGPGAANAKGRVAAPGGVPFADDAQALAIALDPDHAADIASVAKAIPHASEVEAGALIVVLPLAELPSLASRVFAALGGKSRVVPRALRASALLARGYVRLGAGFDEKTRTELAWGYAPAASSEPESSRATGPC